MAKTAKSKTAAASRIVANRTYFLTFLVPTSFTDSETNGIKEAVVALVTKHKGSVVNNEDWGKRRTAYKIKHGGKWQTDAHYVHLTLSLDPAEVPLLERDVYLNQNLMRHLLVVADEVEANEAPAESNS